MRLMQRCNQSKLVCALKPPIQIRFKPPIRSIATQPRSRVSFVCIGDEILSGQVREVNIQVLAQALAQRGVELTRVEIVRDNIPELVETLRDHSRRADAVVTSGGVGPTHDDVTYEAAAVAFSDGQLLVHEPTRASLHKFLIEKQRQQQNQHNQQSDAVPEQTVNAARLRMATFPANAQVWPTPGLWVPLVQIQNVFMLPGVPRLFDAMVRHHVAKFGAERAPRARAALWTNRFEGDIAEALSACVATFPNVQIGSYPQSNSLVKLTFEGDSAIETEAAAAHARQLIGGSSEPPALDESSSV